MKRTFLTVVLCLLLAGQGCAGRLLEKDEELLSLLEKTEQLPREFTYRVTAQGNKSGVKGIIEDDLRYSMTFVEEDIGIYELVASDDTLAVRVLAPDRVPGLSGEGFGFDPTIGQLLEVLRSGQWVIDPSGAPPLTTLVIARKGEEIGQDPISDTLGIFAYLRQSVIEAGGVQEWSEEEIAPAYRGVEDTFDKPSLGVTRYDLVRPALPRREAGQESLGEPRVFHFRKMAFYAREGRLIKVVEEIDYERHIDFRRAARDGRPQFLLDMLDQIRAGETEERILPRRVVLELSFNPDARVAIPVGMTASLGPLFSFGATQGAGGGGAGAGEQAEPSPPPAGAGESPSP